MPKLIIKRDGLLIRKLSLPEKVVAFTVGSGHGNDIILEDERISHFHLQIEKQDNEYFVRDLQSQSGIYVNGTKISNRTDINSNDEIGIGNHTIIFQNPKVKSTSSLILEDHKLEQSASNGKIEDKLANVPALTNLNSWLHEEDNIYDGKGDLSIESDDKDQSDSFLAFEKDNDRSDKDSVQDFIESNDYSYVESDLDVESEIVLQSERIPTSNLDKKDESIQDSEFDEKSKKKAVTHYVIGIYGPYLGKKFKLKHPETKIGRDRKRNDIVIRKNSKRKIDQSISRRHAAITFRNNKYYVTDKRSKNRTYVNQKKLDVIDEVQIVPGDEIAFGGDQRNHIFRLVRKGDWNFSFPKKAGAWHIRYRIAILNICSILSILAAILIFADSFRTRNLISKKPNPLTAKEAIWITDDTNSEIGGSKDTKLSFYPAIADLNGDNIIDVAYIDSEGNLRSINGKTKKPLWTNYDFQALSHIPVTLEDLNNNGLPDVIVVSNDQRVRTIDGKWGIEIWKSPILAGPLIGPPVVGDFNGDGFKDLAIASLENVLHIGFLTLKNSRWVKIDIKEPIRAIAAAQDFTGNGIPNIFMGTETGKIIIIDGTRQKILEEVNINVELKKVYTTFDQDNKIRFPVAFGDLNGDNTTDLIISTIHGNIIAFNSTTLESFWYDQVATNSDFDQTTNQSISLGDLDGDGFLDIASLTPDGRLRALKCIGIAQESKMVLWEYPDAEDGNFVGTPVLADFNKNGTMDVVAVDKDGYIYIFEGSTGDILWKNTKRSLALMSLPLVGDLDDDNYLDILALRSDGNFYKISTNSLTLGSTVVWGQMFGNSRHTNMSTYRDPDASEYYLYMVISIFVILVVVGLNILIRRKRRILSNHQIKM